MDELDEKIEQLKAEMREYEDEQEVEEEKRARIINDLKQQVCSTFEQHLLHIAMCVPPFSLI